MKLTVYAAIDLPATIGAIYAILTIAGIDPQFGGVALALVAGVAWKYHKMVKQ